VGWEVGDFRREVEQSESEVSEDERAGEDESAFGIVASEQKQRQEVRSNPISLHL
jgi:hypothetical protein